MPYQIQASIIHHNGTDYWGTWFIEECDRFGPFGVNAKHLDLICPPKIGYSAGARVFLDDAPFFKHSGKEHLVYGPYEVVPATLTSGSREVFRRKGELLVYEEAHPENGPWLDRTISRMMDGERLRIRQLASEYNFFPFRFSIRRTQEFRVERVAHRAACWLCK